MKPSRRNIANAVRRREERSGKKPALSKYAAKKVGPAPLALVVKI
jgi:hypothetical protein